MNSVIQQLTGAILAQTVPDKSKGITHPGNWPDNAMYGVSYKLHDKQFPQVRQETYCEFFTSGAELSAWRKSKSEWIRSTDFDFSLEGMLYEWDLGPNYVTCIRM